MRSAPKLVRSATSSALLAAVLAPLAVLACAEEGETPKDCPAQKLYDITDPDASSDPAVQNAREAAIDKDCLTPAGSATSGTLPPSMGGTAGTGGSGGGGRGGSGGKGGKGGSGGSSSDAGAGGV